MTDTTVAKKEAKQVKVEDTAQLRLADKVRNEVQAQQTEGQLIQDLITALLAKRQGKVRHDRPTKEEVDDVARMFTEILEKQNSSDSIVTAASKIVSEEAKKLREEGKILKDFIHETESYMQSGNGILIHIEKKHWEEVKNKAPKDKVVQDFVAQMSEHMEDGRGHFNHITKIAYHNLRTEALSLYPEEALRQE